MSSANVSGGSAAVDALEERGEVGLEGAVVGCAGERVEVGAQLRGVSCLHRLDRDRRLAGEERDELHLVRVRTRSRRRRRAPR